MNEIWKPIDGTNGIYEVSNTGKIRSANHRRTGKPMVLKAQPDKKGYLRIHVRHVGLEKETFKVHREVAIAFLPNPENKPHVNHKDGDKTNNHVDNLEWVTNKENAVHAMRIGLWGNVLAASARTNEARKTAIIAISIKTGERTRYESMRDAERAIGTKHINAVISGSRKQAMGYRFEYADGR